MGRRTGDEIVAVIEGAFAPLRCVAEMWGADTKIRFQIFGDAAHPLYMRSELFIMDLNLGSLEGEIQLAREHLHRVRGIQLAAWEMPTE